MGIKRLLSIILILLLAFVLPACDDRGQYDDVPGESDAQLNEDQGPEETKYYAVVKGHWELTGKTDTYVQESFEGNENTKLFDTVDSTLHRYRFRHSPDPDHPSSDVDDLPYTAEMECEITLPDRIDPDIPFNIGLEARIISNGNPSATVGVCCRFDILYRVIDMTSSRGLDYSQVSNYPLFAGRPMGYGHLGDEYSEGMSDTVAITVPHITEGDTVNGKAANITIYFDTNIADSEFTYTWVSD